MSTAIRTCGRGNDELSTLLDRGVNVDARNIEGETPLIALAHLAHELSEVMESWFRSKVRFFVDRGADVNAQSRNGHTALILSAFWNTFKITQTLLDAGADPNLKNNDGFAALMLAQAKGHEQLAKMLRRTGAME